jgi:citrate lyase subunit beta/citryl-CoA lyase/(S)-citramalyl-CoA lyase
MTHTAFRSLLFVPGNRPERFAKALAAGADAVCIDLEDAVPPDAKAEGRAAVLAWLATRPADGPAVGVRINGMATLDGFADVLALAQADGAPDFIMIPKAAGPAELRQLGEVLGARASALWPIVESAVGLRHAWEIADAPGVAGLLFGGADYSADVGSTMEWDALAHARGTLAAAAAAGGGQGGRQLLDVPYLDVTDADGLRATTARTLAMGFTGRACIHPSQVAVVNEVYTPSDAEVERARAVIAALEAADGKAALFNGKLVEKPVILAAQRTLARARPV